MSKMATDIKNNKKDEIMKAGGQVTNFMGGVSYTINPLDTLKMVSSSSIFGEPQYYRDGAFAEARVKDGTFGINRFMTDYVLKELDPYKGLKTSELMEKAIDEALAYDFQGTLEWAVELRKNYLMRLNPQVIMVRAAVHKNRAAFTAEHPGFFNQIQEQVMGRGDDVILQATYYLYMKRSKKEIPSILKRSWAKKISSLNRYELHKYRNAGIGMIDTVRLCHISGSDIDELMRTGNLEVESGDQTWEMLRASGADWKTITDNIRMGHMALLRNLRGIFNEVENEDFCESQMDLLKRGVKNGKQFPFRYLSARRAVEGSEDIHHKDLILKTLEDCMDLSCENLPKLKGKSAFLSDNSGSAWGTFQSEYGSVTVADIDNLSAVIGAKNSEEGTVFLFGDTLIRVDLDDKDAEKGVLELTDSLPGKEVGMSTECGVWLFFEEAIRTKEHWDNIFIYSDQQAGHGGLYGTDEACRIYTSQGYNAGSSHYIDVAKLIDAYRREVNPYVNVYSIQTAGYNNVLVPESGYRTNILYGWTGKELVYADVMNRFWDEKDQRL